MNLKRSIQIAVMAAIMLVFVSSAAFAENETSWLADDMTESYHEGTLNFLGDPSGAGLSVYDNYVFYVNGSTYLRSKWKNPTQLPPDKSWAWGSGNVGGWAYTTEGTFISFDMVSPPSYIYVGQQPVAYASYVSQPSYTEGNHLYIQGQDSWTKRVVAPFGSSVWLLAYTKTAGTADVYKVGPGGVTTVDTVPIPAGDSHMSFNASIEGRHLVTFVKDNMPSETVIIDVVPEETFFQ